MRVLWGFMGLFLLNISVDTADPEPEHVPEDLSINDQESIVELFVEKILGFDDAIGEYDDHDTEDHDNKSVKIDLLVHLADTNNEAPYQARERRKRFPDLDVRFNSDFLEIDCPPPKI